MDVTSDLVGSHETRLMHKQMPVPECTAPENSPQVTSSQKHIKRPLNSFMLWAQKQRQRIAMNNPQMPNSEISKKLGAEWRNLSESDKDPFIEEAKKLKRQHEIDHPNYRFVQRRKRKFRSIRAARNDSSCHRTGTSSDLADNNGAVYPSFTYVNSTQTFRNNLNGFVLGSMPSSVTSYTAPSFSSTADTFGGNEEVLRNVWPFLGYTATPVSNFYPLRMPYFQSNLMSEEKGQGSGDMSLADMSSAFRLM